jgi:hypothetical protein
MTREALVPWLRREPFLPIEIRMSTGDRYAVAHPEYAAMGHTNVHVFFPGTDRFAELALRHIAGVKVMETPARSET